MIFLYRDLNLKQPIYEATAENGHFGHEQFPWEQAKQLHLSDKLANKIKANEIPINCDANGYF